MVRVRAKGNAKMVTLEHERLITLNSGDEFLGLLRDFAIRHKRYRHYSKLCRIEQIAKTGRITLSDGSDWNDPVDRDRFNPKGLPGRRYGMCFSYSSDESIAMWMLYGGARNRGAALELSGSDFIGLSSVNQVELGDFEDERFVAKMSLGASEFLVEQFEVLYYQRLPNGDVKMRTSRESPTIPADSLIAQFVGDGQYRFHPYLKGFPWRYEGKRQNHRVYSFRPIGATIVDNRTKGDDDGCEGHEGDPPRTG